MANRVLMPQLGISEDSAVLMAWRVKTGDTVKAGDVLFSLETGKSAFDVESEYAGTVLALLVSEGDEVAVKAPVCLIGEPGETIDNGQWTMDNEETTVPKPEMPPPPPAASPIVNCQLSTVNCQAVSPRARHLAEKNDIDPKRAVPTGPEGRVIERDVRALLETDASPSHPLRSPIVNCQLSIVNYQDRPLSHMRKTIAKAMSASLRDAAQLTHTASFDASDLLGCRKRFKADAERSGVTLTDMILYAVTRTLPDFPALNAHLLGDTLRVFDAVNLACAVDTERGLMVPVLFGASRMSLPEISQGLKTLAGQCRDGSVAPELLTGGSFTVSNLGQFGIESFTPILNPPQTGILGVNTITTRVREQDGRLVPYPCMTLSLTYDHRALDGAPASQFLQTLCKKLEDFASLLTR
jgi:pyruvate dehydrogenase E2 component (dihydrolipoamide acetyltransferase)